VGSVGKKFAFNFILSFALGIIFAGIGFVLVQLDNVSEEFPATLGGLFTFLGGAWIVAGLPITYFFIGYKCLKQPENQKLEFFSVTSSFICSAVIISINIALQTEVSDLVFEVPTFLSVMMSNSFIIWAVIAIVIIGEKGLYIVAALPAAIMWLGMYYRKNKEDTSRILGILTILASHIALIIPFIVGLWLFINIAILTSAIIESIKVKKKTGKFGIGLILSIISMGLLAIVVFQVLPWVG
jgi:hypothetical protein